MKTQPNNCAAQHGRRVVMLICGFSLCWLFSMHTQSFAQSAGGGVLLGAVTDRTGAAIVGARVVARSTFLATQREAVTDATGQFTFSNLAPADDYEVSVTMNDFRGWARNGIAVAHEQRMTVDAALETGLLSEAVTVTAARGERDTLDTPEPISVVSQQRLQERNLSNVVESLRELPGVSVQSGGPMGVKPVIRGLDGARVLLLVDGVRFNNSRQRTDHTGGGEAVEPGLIDISQVESVEVVRGGGSVLYGSDAVGGIFNVNVRGGYTIRTEHVGYHFTLGVENIGNRFYTEAFSISNIPEKGRTLVGGLRLRFY